MGKKVEYTYAVLFRREYVPGNQVMDSERNIFIPIDCVFCGEHFEAIRRSFKGTGKKCPSCGAHYSADGYATPLTVWVQRHATSA